MKKEKRILSDFDSLDVNDVIISIERSFNISFEENDFIQIKTYGQLEDYVLSRIKGKETNDCTSQQAFYKLRKILVKEFNIPYNKIKLDTKLEEIFPKKERKNNILMLKKLLKSENEILTFSTGKFIILAIIFISAIYLLFTNFFYGIVLFIIGKILSEELKKNKFLYRDLREFSNKLVINNYKNSRRNSATYNPKEVKDIIKDIFSDSLQIEKSKIQYDTIL